MSVPDRLQPVNELRIALRAAPGILARASPKGFVGSRGSAKRFGGTRGVVGAGAGMGCRHCEWVGQQAGTLGGHRRPRGWRINGGTPDLTRLGPFLTLA